jgi:ferric-dicitrate binding protein FerR (iron transport regulator)
MKQELEHNLQTNPKFIDWVLAPSEVSEEYWRNWLEKNPGRSKEFEEAKFFLTHIHFTDNSARLNESKLLKQIHTQIEAKNPPRLRLKHFLGMAASIALIFCTWFFFPSNDNIFNTQFSEIKELTLPDGSSVVINANTELKIMGDWDANDDRNVYLTGEAYFDVSETPLVGSSKFNVHTSKGIVKVLGTKFNVKDRIEEFSVALDQGKITFEAEEEILTLNPGEVIVETGEKLRKQEDNTQNFSTWKDMKMNLANVKLQEIANVLEDFHGIEITLDKSALKTRPVYEGLLDYSDLEGSLLTINLVYGINSKQDGQTITFSY